MRTDHTQLTGLVSCHAVTRYIQRILGITVPGPFANSHEEMDFHCDAAGLHAEQVRALIMTPAVALCCVMGMGQARTREFVAKIAPTGIITTICVNKRPEYKRLRVMDRKEGRRESHRHTRRCA